MINRKLVLGALVGIAGLAMAACGRKEASAPPVDAEPIPAAEPSAPASPPADTSSHTDTAPHADGDQHDEKAAAPPEAAPAAKSDMAGMKMNR
ncbi:hypothetical protein [Phenylobacterium sp. CCH12-B4]|jgi:hypothetical protein|uniref:hypothetical protein n=1 Tax=Phenylobacterium sp. CCH12-B4 TaxID=1768784 RepID=UPI00083B6908|nr:hypothetical protein [Phenylobacterium sp. CCH12-B4]